MMIGKSFKPSKDHDVRIAYKGKELSSDDKIFPIFSKKFDNIVTLLFRKKLKGIINYQLSRMHFLIRNPKNKN